MHLRRAIAPRIILTRPHAVSVLGPADSACLAQRDTKATWVRVASATSCMLTARWCSLGPGSVPRNLAADYEFATDNILWGIGPLKTRPVPAHGGSSGLHWRVGQ
ncbi:hypothetical protein DENSPDRAFT_350815 [Dentipellis sp. KUC8613]|nr:hypothetical protein DENSPDRAFT_350815 [Dentipellis sp. KUC8613]